MILSLYGYAAAVFVVFIITVIPICGEKKIVPLYRFSRHLSYKRRKKNYTISIKFCSLNDLFGEQAFHIFFSLSSPYD